MVSMWFILKKTNNQNCSPMITVSCFLPKYHTFGWVNGSFFFFWLQLI